MSVQNLLDGMLMVSNDPDNTRELAAFQPWSVFGNPFLGMLLSFNNGCLRVIVSPVCAESVQAEVSRCKFIEIELYDDGLRLLFEDKSKNPYQLYTDYAANLGMLPSSKDHNRWIPVTFWTQGTEAASVIKFATIQGRISWRRS